MGCTDVALCHGMVVNYLETEALVSETELSASLSSIDEGIFKQLLSLTKLEALNVGFCQNVDQHVSMKSDNVSAKFLAWRNVKGDNDSRVKKK